jgi:hypothetical protein
LAAAYNCVTNAILPTRGSLWAADVLKGLIARAVDALKAGPPEDFQHEGNQRRRPDDCCEHPTHQIDPCRRLGEPSQGNFKVLGDQTEVCLVCLIGFEGCEVVIIRHAHFLGEAGYAIITRRTTKAILRIKLVIRRADPQSVYVQGFNAAKVLDKSRSTPFFIDVDWEALAKPT